MSLFLRINNQLVEVDADGVVAPFTYSVADMKQPDKRKTSSSKTIKLFGTQRNLAILRNVYVLPVAQADAPLQFTFDPRTRIEAIYTINGITVFDGLFQVLKAVRRNEMYEFECVLISNIANVIQQWGDLKISDLGWTEYNHDLTKTNIENSWSTSVIQNGTAVNNFTGGIPNGFGYVYGWFDLGYEYPSLTPLNQATNQLTAGVYFREVLSKMMAFINQQYTLSINNQEFWKRLTLFNEAGSILTIDEDAAIARSAEIQQNLPNIITTPNAIFTNNGNSFNFEQRLVLNNTVADPNSQVQTDGTIVIGQTGTYQMALSGSLSGSLSGTFSGVLANIGKSFFIQLKKNGIFIDTAIQASLPNTLNTSQNYSWNVIGDYKFEQGDELEVVLVVVMTGVPSGQTLTMTLSDGGDIQTELIAIDGILSDNDNVNITRYLPNMKCADFYRSIMRMFNLYQVDTDAGIRIVPAVDFFGGTNSAATLDWSDKLDYSKDIEIEPPNRIEGKNYVYRYTPEADFYHALYQQEFGTGYGDMTYEVPNTWQQGDNVIEVGFSIGIPAAVIYDNIETNVVMPSIYKKENEQTKPFKGKAPRIYFYNGYKPANEPCRLFLSNETDPTAIQRNDVDVFPSFHHLLNHLAPTMDLLFAPTNRLYYLSGLITNNTLYVKYWERFIKELTSADAKILTAYFKLSNIDIHNLDFSKLINIDGVVYRLNIVHDFTNQDRTTKVELIKVIEGSNRFIRPIGLDNVFPAPAPGPIVIDLEDLEPADLKSGQIAYDSKLGQLVVRIGNEILTFTPDRDRE